MMNKPEVIAFYLPQYHPTQENDEWYGPGFTEWTNVGKSKPLYKGHYQPKIPADLGYYDLRVPEVRNKQAELAKEAGISAFCYYHYWFGNGRQLLEKPLQEVVKSKEPDFPFCICWANHTWYNKMWNADANILEKIPLMTQEYPGPTDWDAHFYALLDTFKDDRYYCVNDKLLFVIYHLEEIPDAEAFFERWQILAQKEGLPGFHFMSYVDDVADVKNPIHNLCQEKIVLCKANIGAIKTNKLMRKINSFAKSLFSQIFHLPLLIYNYKKIRHLLVDKCFSDENVCPVLLPNWDNTPRRGYGAMVLKDATPEQFYLHCKDVFEFVKNKKQKYVFLKSWNEWGEGNYMEPCIRYGHGYINALSSAITENTLEK